MKRHATSTGAGEQPFAFSGKIAQEMSIWTELVSFPRFPSYTFAVRSVATSYNETNKLKFIFMGEN